MKTKFVTFALMLILQYSYADNVVNYSALHDPTTPLGDNDVVPTEQSIDLDLAMTFISNSNKTAIINGDLYSIGSIVSGYEIISIEQNKVILQSVSSGEVISLVTKRSLVLEKKSGQNTNSRNGN